MSQCDFKLAAAIAPSCEKPAVRGLQNTVYLYNFDSIDWDSIGDYGTNNIITSLPIKSGERGYTAYMPGKTPFNGTQKAMTEGNYRNKFEKTLALIILDNGPDVSHKVIDQLANGKFVAVVENKYSGADGKNTFEVYGLEQGLSAKEMTDEKYSEDTDGGWAVTLVESEAPTSGIYFFSTSASATRALLEASLTAAT